MYDDADGNGDQEDLNGWASKDLENSNGGWAHDDAWETSAPSQTQMPPQPPAKDHSKSQKKQPQHHQHQHPHQQQQLHHQHHQQPQSSNGWGSGGGAWDAGNQGAPAPAKHQNAKLSQTTQRAMVPAWSTWSHEAGRGQGGDIEEIEEEEWSSDEEDPWGQPATGWDQQPQQQRQPARAPQAYAQHQPRQQSSWHTWGEEARRLPKVTFNSAITSSPSSTGSKASISQLQRFGF